MHFNIDQCLILQFVTKIIVYYMSGESLKGYFVKDLCAKTVRPHILPARHEEPNIKDRM